MKSLPANLVFTYFLFIVINSNLVAHQDHSELIYKDNIITEYIAGACYEERIKAEIITQLAALLCNKMNYHDSIYIKMQYKYTDNYCDDFNNSHFNIFYKNINLERWKSNDSSEIILTKNTLNIYAAEKVYKPVRALKLLEFAIKNFEKLKDTNSNFFNNSDKAINNILNQPNSDIINELIQNRIERPNDIKPCDEFKNEKISYYYKDEKYYVVFKKAHFKGKPYEFTQDTVVLCLNNVYDFRLLNYSKALIFDTDTTFYYLSNMSSVNVSKKQEINIKKNTHNITYFPYQIKDIGGEKISIYYGYSYLYDYFEKIVINHNFIYLTDKDILVNISDFSKSNLIFPINNIETTICNGDIGFYQISNPSDVFFPDARTLPSQLSIDGGLSYIPQSRTKYNSIFNSVLARNYLYSMKNTPSLGISAMENNSLLALNFRIFGINRLELDDSTGLHLNSLEISVSYGYNPFKFSFCKLFLTSTLGMVNHYLSIGRTVSLAVFEDSKKFDNWKLNYDVSSAKAFLSLGSYLYMPLMKGVDGTFNLVLKADYQLMSSSSDWEFGEDKKAFTSSNFYKSGFAFSLGISWAWNKNWR